MVEKKAPLTSGSSVLILSIAMALPLASNAQTFGFEESEGRVEQGEAESVQQKHEAGSPQERKASAEMTAHARNEEQTPAVRLSSHDSSTPAATLVDNDSELDAIVTQVAREAVDRVELLDGQSRSRSVVASVDLAERFVIVRLDAAFVPASYGSAFEDQVSLISNAILHVAEKVEPVRGVKYLYGGYDIYHYFPEVKADDDEAREAGERRRQERASRGVRDSGAAFVSAGHGYYFNHKSKTWETQRKEHNGVLEDMVTPSYASELKSLLEVRSKMPVIRPRVQVMTGLHPESGHDWWRMAARYAIAHQYPGRTDIWNTFAGSTANDREYNEDINSRPLLANHHDADFAVHLHSNADDGLTARGSRVIIQAGRPQDAALAQSVLCSMKEQIQVVPGYASFTVASAPHAANKGENRLAKMPSIIVETAFHTHPEDAKALLDPAFRAGSMKGVEKGIRLFREGRTCQPFVLAQLPDVSLPTGSSKEQPMVFTGNPQFPVTMEFTTANCSKPGACKPSKTTFTDPNAPIKAIMRCHGTLTGTARWSVVLRDVDGVATAPVEFQQTCHKPGAA